MKLALQKLALFLIAGLVIGAAGCGGYNSSNQTNYNPTPAGQTATSHAAINIGDAPSDRVIAFELTINSVVLTASDNTTVSVLAQPRRIELTHLAATTEPLVLMNIPQGRYKSAASLPGWQIYLPADGSA